MENTEKEEGDPMGALCCAITNKKLVHREGMYFIEESIFLRRAAKEEEIQASKDTRIQMAMGIYPFNGQLVDVWNTDRGSKLEEINIRN